METLSQFCRLVLLLQAKKLNVRFFCQDALAPLLRSQTDIKNISISLNGSNKRALWVPLMGLPKLLDIETNNIPFAKGYIKIDRILKKSGKINWVERKEKIDRNTLAG